MAGRRYSEFAKNLGFPAASASQQGNEGTPSKLDGDVFGKRGNKDPGGNMPMVMTTKTYGKPGGYKTQPRDRSWGMRQADGLAQCSGLGGPGDDEYETTFVKR